MARRNKSTVSELSISSDDEMRESESFKDINLVELISILPCRLQLAIMTKKPKVEENSNFYLFSTDEQLLYANFYEDFGPLNLAKLYRYCDFLNKALQEETRETKAIIHYTRKDPKKILNAAFLIGCYSLIYLRFSVQTVMKALGPILKHASGAKYCDASINDLAFLSLRDCLSGVFKAIQRNLFNFEDFNVDDYEYYECVENGDLNWIVPGKLLAFCGPNSRTERTNDTVMLGPEVYIDYFQAHNVTVVVRLNSPKYDAHVFTKAGIQHFDLYFSDGSTPSERLAKQFLKICENARGAVAVHCKAGLGRTGTLIGAYLMKHYQFSAMESIAWLRICRPGSVIGQQQAWLNSKQSQLLQEGEIYRQQRQNFTYPPEKHARGVYSLQVAMENDDTPNVKTPGLKPTMGHAIDSENMQGISQRVDTMCLNDEDEQDSERFDVASQVNNNVVHCKPNRIKKVAKLTSRYIRGNRLNGGRTIVTTTTTTTTTIRRGRGNANVPPSSGTQQRASLQETHVSRKKTTVTSRQTVPSRTEPASATSVRNQRNASVQTASQGDQLNSIKAARRHLVPTESIQQKTRGSKVILPPASTNANPSDRNIKLTANVADKEKSDGTLQTRNETAKNNHPSEGTSQPILKTMKLTRIVPTPRSPLSCTAEHSSRHVAPTSSVFQAGKGDNASQNTDKFVSPANTTMTRTMKKNLPTEGPNPQRILSRHQFLTKLNTNVTQGKEVSYETSVPLEQLLSALHLGSTSLLNPAKMKKRRTYETLVTFDPETENHLTDIFTFTVCINLVDLFSDDVLESKCHTSGNTTKPMKSTRNASTKDVNASKKGIRKKPLQEHDMPINPLQKSMSAKLTWLVEENNQLKFRVTFDLEAMNNIITVPVYMYYPSRSATTVVKRQFETTVAVIRTIDYGFRINFSVKLDLLQVLGKPKMQGTLAPKAASQPCPSTTFNTIPSCPGVWNLGEDVNCAMAMLDHNGNDPSATTRHEKQLLDKPKMQRTLAPKAASQPCPSTIFNTIPSCPSILDFRTYVSDSMETVDQNDGKHDFSIPKMQGTLAPETASQPCPSTTFDTIPSCPSILDFRTYVSDSMEMVDRNGNDAPSPTQHDKQQALTPRTTNKNAETDTRPYKRMRVEVSRL
ncbi:uncharacterized protein LOC125762017 isoform X1 [Anopheles funestus]|uniref:uncharacterized protein LOC125762017 isoform X1 n=1 Tax=Anopheles funestus TaxID=62324 RepID=UPI0020C71322|nr:uncharacterized protein LOC125762017 isoform X1 [Anopheles funestus]XP_049279649.1 uncharacterized protein LOC125762017 isoform X1 [Anopheles funestus]XP_049279658.1 uncharacterized protein LOC125762017 isoform X1 [Anopheles funestus]XP_049279667.1 uncharacterized protein LOC125762017 isoform X1 [Anopheles funestus]